MWVRAATVANTAEDTLVRTNPVGRKLRAAFDKPSPSANTDSKNTGKRYDEGTTVARARGDW